MNSPHAARKISSSDFNCSGVRWYWPHSSSRESTSISSGWALAGGTTGITPNNRRANSHWLGCLDLANSWNVWTSVSASCWLAARNENSATNRSNRSTCHFLRLTCWTVLQHPWNLKHRDRADLPVGHEVRLRIVFSFASHFALRLCVFVFKTASSIQSSGRNPSKFHRRFWE